jgi:GNAT superfamily N-acetyltransferase
MYPVRAAAMMEWMSEQDISLRAAERRDAGDIAAIYASIVRETAISFETDPPSPDAMAARIENTLKRYPWLVAVHADKVLGYTYAGEHRQRAAYRWSVDVTIYVAASARGQGIGRKLYGALTGICARKGSAPPSPASPCRTTPASLSTRPPASRPWGSTRMSASTWRMARRRLVAVRADRKICPSRRAGFVR